MSGVFPKSKRGLISGGLEGKDRIGDRMEMEVKNRE